MNAIKDLVLLYTHASWSDESSVVRIQHDILIKIKRVCSLINFLRIRLLFICNFVVHRVRPHARVDFYLSVKFDLRNT